MKASPSHPRGAASTDWRPLAAAVGIVVAGIAAYAPSFSGAFVFDDEPGLLLNPTIRHLGSSLFPLPDSTLGGRPVANVSFALNYALSGTHAWSYHTANLLIHILAGLTLLGLCRRTLLRARVPTADATLLAVAASLLWTLHPLQTEAVTYVVQRVESLMALFYLLTFYGFVRSLDEARHARRWRWLAVGSCLLGMGTKEVMATAPLLLLLYDRTFVAGSLRTAWRERRGFYVALAATWLPLAFLVASTGWNRGGTAGFDVGVSPWAYWLTQFPAIARYLWLSAWPHPLVFDYPTFWITHAAEVAPYAIVVLVLAAATIWALRRRPAAGFLGTCLFLILAPTSLVPGTIQMVVEHRMYLPLAAVTVAAAWGAHRLLGRRGVIALVALAPGLGCIAAQRNAVYHTAEALWGNTLATCPDNDRAHNNLGNILARQGQFPAAITHFQAAIRLNPAHPDTHYNFGNALRQMHRTEEAVAQYEQALRINPRMPDARTALGESLAAIGRPDDAIAHLEQALKIDPNYARAHRQLGIALTQAGRGAEAIAHFEAALRLNPSDDAMHDDLGNALRAAGRVPEAIAQYEAALKLKPNSVEAHHNLANALCQADRLPEAIAHYEQALSAAPARADIRNHLGMALLMAERPTDAIAQFERALQTNPSLGEVHLNLAMALQSVGRTSEAAAHYEAARRLGVVPPAP